MMAASPLLGECELMRVRISWSSASWRRRTWSVRFANDGEKKRRTLALPNLQAKVERFREDVLRVDEGVLVEVAGNSAER